MMSVEPMWVLRKRTKGQVAVSYAYISSRSDGVHSKVARPNVEMLANALAWPWFNLVFNRIGFGA